MVSLIIPLSLFGVQADTWQAVEAIAVSVGVGIALMGLLGLSIAVYQLIEQTRARHLQGLVATLEQFTEVASPELRLWLEAQDAGSMAYLGEQDQEKALRLIYAFNRVGLLVRERFIPKRLILSLFGEVAVSYWEKLLPFIEQRRKKFPRTGIHYQRLCDEAKTWMRSKEFENEVKAGMDIFADKRPKG